ncbi:MAG: hypothetical protein ACOC0F_02265 [archaeon]
MSHASTQSATAGSETGGIIRPKVFTYALGLWVLTVGLAITNAIFRETVIAPATSELLAHQISTITLIGLIALLSYAYFTRWAFEHTRTELLGVGVLWLGLTVAFEFLFGHYVMGNSWSGLLQQYDLLAGYVWIFVPLTMLVAPLVFGYSLRR